MSRQTTVRKTEMKPQTVKILVIEDDQDDALLFEEALAEVDKSFKPKMEWVESLEDGVDRISSSAYDLVFLDLSLPGTHGIDTFLSLRDQFPNLPIVILTGFTHDSFADEARRQGAREYLVKGELDGEVLTRVIQSVLE
jgi:two-component system, cell cycle response regulator